MLASLGDFRTLRLDDSLVRLKRWEFTGAGEIPEVFGAEWVGEEHWPASEFASSYPDAPVLSARVAGLLREELLSAGRLVPVRRVRGAGPRKPGDAAELDHVVYVVEKVVDCLDPARSSAPRPPTGEIERAVFRPDALPVELPAFRLPQFPVAVYWNAWAVDRLRALLGPQVEARLAWSQDPAARPHPNLWGV
ncbi:hypothetical protein D7294_09650 [Streptomyces hoynatensis]|uniref:Uncharacterized protein n=1 Tax=Streptomyces hoynatensis TaxID=1141874 RepID=A0A3A9Z9Y0_9ACTN|nr:hypothetical protein D7294_09650 [Streptomyces hoynatensis]